jgi:phosphoglucomutase
MALALEKAEELGADIILGTDPDTDRVGMGIRNPEGRMELINGNQAAALLLHFLLENRSLEDKKKGFIAKTIVTSDLLSDIAEAHDVPCYETLTGFKYIAELIRKQEGHSQFIGGGEESYGYLVGDFVRDKDAVISSVMLCEMAAWARERGMTVDQLLKEVYERYGIYREALVSLVKKGMDGAAQINSIMTLYRDEMPKEIADVKVVQVADYMNSVRIAMDTGQRTELDLPRSNVLQFFMEDGSKITARPSGTEPKIKYYLSVKQVSVGNLEDSWNLAGDRVNKFKTALGI